CAQIFFVTSLRGSGSVPTILARSSEGCIGFIKALFFVLGVVFAIVPLHPCRKRAYLHDHRNCNGSGSLMRNAGSSMWLPSDAAATRLSWTAPIIATNRKSIGEVFRSSFCLVPNTIHCRPRTTTGIGLCEAPDLDHRTAGPFAG